MISVEWTSEAGWAAPHLSAYAPLQLEASASCLHYATQCFEGMKLYRGVDGRLRLFRPRLNAERFNRSSARASLPTFDPAEVVKLIVALCARDGPKFLPHSQSEASSSPFDQRLLYIRPMMIGTDPDLGIKPPASAKMVVFLTPFLALDRHFIGRPQPGLKLLASATNEVRAWPGGFGAAKLGANYGPSLVAQRQAADRGYDQVLWLYSYPDPLQDDPLEGRVVLADATTNAPAAPRREGVVTEAGASNILVVWKAADGVTEVVTAPLTGGLILDGVTRRSVLDLARERLAGALPAGESVRVVERWFTMADVANAAAQGRLLEAFAVGTAYFLSPVSRVCWKGQDIQVPNGKDGIMGPILTNLKTWIGNIMFGNEEHEWALVVPEEA